MHVGALAHCAAEPMLRAVLRSLYCPSFLLFVWLVAAIWLGACGGAAPRDPVVAIPSQPAPTASGSEPGPRPIVSDTPVAKAAPPERPAGANGPSDARGMIGDAGAIEPIPHRATLLVSSAAIRAHPAG